MRGRVGSHPGAELLLPVGLAAGSRAPSGGRQQRVEASSQAGASDRSEHQQRRQREEAQHDERRGAAVGQQRAARGAGRRVDLRTGRMVRRGGGGSQFRGGARGRAEPRGKWVGCGGWGWLWARHFLAEDGRWETQAVNDPSRSPLRGGSENSCLAPRPPPSSPLCSPWSFPSLASDPETLPLGAASWCQPSLLQPTFGPPPLLYAYRKRDTGPTCLYPPHPRPSRSPFHRWGNPSPGRRGPQRGCVGGPEGWGLWTG